MSYLEPDVGGKHLIFVHGPPGEWRCLAAVPALPYSQRMSLRAPIKALVEGPALADDTAIETIEWAERTIDAFERPANDDEAEALLKVLARSDDDCFGLKWTILHFIETAPSWPNWPALAAHHGEWIERLKISAKNAGRNPS